MNGEKEKLVLENRKLVYYLVQKLGVIRDPQEYDDIVSIGMIGLIKAAETFDLSKNNRFATYASICIKNEIFMYCRRVNKHVTVISIDAPLKDVGDGVEYLLRDTIEHPESNFAEKLANREYVIELVNVILNCLKEKYRLALLYKLGDAPQVVIAEKLNISPGYVSKIVKRANNKMREIANQELEYKKVFSMSVVGDEYRISFSSKDIPKFNQIFESFLKNIKSTEKLPDFKINCSSERVMIKAPARQESFIFIAQIIQEIDDFNRTFVSAESTMLTKTEVVRKIT